MNLNQIRMKINHESLWIRIEMASHSKLIWSVKPQEEIKYPKCPKQWMLLREVCIGCLKLKPCHPWTSSSGFKCFWGGKRWGAETCRWTPWAAEKLKDQRTHWYPWVPVGKGCRSPLTSLFLILSLSVRFLSELKNSRRCGLADRCITAYC